jgi:putative phosphoribosyl transferase
MPFRDRAEAGRRLAKSLVGYTKNKPIILAFVRGGAPVAAEIARSLDAPLDIILVRKIGVPFQPELAMGAVVDGSTPSTVRNDDVIRAAGISEADFDAIRDRELVEIHRRRQRYMGGRAHLNLTGRFVIVVDDGVATGATTRAALRAVRKKNPAKLILAVPVASREALRDLRGEADAIVCLEDHEFFGSIGAYYDDFRQCSDGEVIDILAQFPKSDPIAWQTQANSS